MLIKYSFTFSCKQSCIEVVEKFVRSLNAANVISTYAQVVLNQLLTQCQLLELNWRLFLSNFNLLKEKERNLSCTCNLIINTTKTIQIFGISVSHIVRICPLSSWIWRWFSKSMEWSGVEWGENEHICSFGYKYNSRLRRYILCCYVIYFLICFSCLCFGVMKSAFGRTSSFFLILYVSGCASFGYLSLMSIYFQCFTLCYKNIYVVYVIVIFVIPLKLCFVFVVIFYYFH